MAFRIAYKKLFAVVIRHNYFLSRAGEEFAGLTDAELEDELRTYDLREDVVIAPTAETARAMDRLGMLYRATPSGFLVAADVEETESEEYVPRRAPEPGLRLRFVVRSRSSHFPNYTNLDLARSQRSIYYFSNRAGQQGSDFPNLSLQAPAFESGSVYDAGDLLRRSADGKDVYLCLENGTHSKPHAHVPDWKKLDGRWYANDRDVVRLYPPVFKYHFPAGRVVEATLTVESTDGESLWEESASAEDGESLVEHALDLRALPTGLYNLVAAGEDSDGESYEDEQRIYVDPDLPGRKVFALAEVFHLPGGALSDYRLLDTDSDNLLLQPSYVIDLLSRHTIWRYTFDSPPEPGTDLGDLKKANGTYVTKDALPLTKRYQVVAYDHDRLLPNPSPFAIKPEEKHVFSDIFV